MWLLHKGPFQKHVISIDVNICSWKCGKMLMKKREGACEKNAGSIVVYSIVVVLMCELSLDKKGHFVHKVGPREVRVFRGRKRQCCLWPHIWSHIANMAGNQNNDQYKQPVWVRYRTPTIECRRVCPSFPQHFPPFPRPDVDTCVVYVSRQRRRIRS